jgi:protein translocase SecG subunit
VVVILVWILSIVLVVLCGVIVFLILGQDVRGGGLAGALGGGSVQSAFGSRTTETVLKLTAYLIAAIFIIVVVLIKVHSWQSDALTGGPVLPTPTTTGAPIEPGTTPVPAPESTPAPAPAPAPAPESTPAPAPAPTNP